MRVAIGFMALVAAAGTARAAPCFPGKDVAPLRSLRSNLKETVNADGEPTGLRGTWGTCTVRRGVVRERDGTRVATVSCGVSIHVPGILASDGIGVGMKGEEVLERRGDGPSSKLVCAHYFEPQVNRTRCLIPPPEGSDESVWGYEVWGRPPAGAADEDGFVRGEKALAFFRTRRVLAMYHRGYCH